MKRKPFFLWLLCLLMVPVVHHAIAANTDLPNTVTFDNQLRGRERVKMEGTANEKFMAGLDLVMKEKYDDALVNFLEANKTDPDNGLVPTGIAFCRLKLGRWKDAEEAAKTATKKDPGFAFAHYLLGISQGLSEHWKDAKKAFNDATRLDPGNAEYHYLFGLSSMKIGFDPSVPDSEAGIQFREARDEFAKAASLKPQHAKARFGLGFMHMVPTQRNRDAARKEYDVLKKLDPDLAAKLKPLIE